jgi:hypothetical protein
MREEEARELIEARVARGGRVVPAMNAELPALRAMQETLLEAGIPAILGPCSSGG